MLPLFAATLSIISLFKKLVKHFLFFIFFNYFYVLSFFHVFYFYVLSFFHVFFVFLLIFILPTKKEPDHSDSFSHTFYFTVPSKLHTNFSSQTYYHFLPWPFGQALDRLVAVSSMPYGTSTPALSTSSSSRGLTLTMGYLILRGASRLDAFSVYPVPTWLPGREPGGSTGTPEVSPSRSSRTKDSSSQISYAHAG